MKLHDRLKFFMISGMRIILPAVNSVIESETVFPIKITGISDNSSTVTVSIIQQTCTVTVTLPVVDGVAEGTAVISFPGGTTFYVRDGTEVPVGRDSEGSVSATSDFLTAENPILFRGTRSFDLGSTSAAVEKVIVQDPFMVSSSINAELSKVQVEDPFELGTTSVTIEKL